MEHSPLRLTLVCPRFWPFSGATELAAADLARALADLGHQVDVVTARWERNWPESFQLRGLPVLRIPRPGQGPWGFFRYQRQLARTLAAEPSSDGIIVFGLGDAGLANARGLGGVPVVVRVDYRQTPYSEWSRLRRPSALAALTRACAIAADSELSATRLACFDVDPSKIEVIPDGVPPNLSGPPTTSDQVNARIALSNAHPILSIDPGQPLVICGAPLDDDEGVADLIAAWQEVVAASPQAKLWLLGDGPRAGALWNRICSADLVYSVILPGFFDNLAPLLTAADLYVHPLRGDRSCSTLVRAMQVGICPVAVESAYARQLVTADQTGIVVSAGKPAQLAKAILHGLHHRDLRRRLGAAAQRRVSQSHDVNRWAARYVELIRSASPSFTSPPP